MAKVSVKNVYKIYPGEKGRDVTAVHDVSLEIGDREFVVRGAAREFIGRPLLLGIRPEDIEPAQFSGNERSTSSFPAIVDIVEPMGAETNLYLQTGAHTVVCRSQRALDHREAGHRFQFEMSAEKAHLFDPATGNRIA